MILRLEEIEPRILLSASPLAEQWAQMAAAAQHEYVNAVNAIVQEVGYLQQQWNLFHGITANGPSQSAGTSNGSTSQITAATSKSSSNTTSQGSIRPYLVGFNGFIWDPVNPAISISANDGHNWDYKGQSQALAVNPVKPGDNGDAAMFDPKTTQNPGLNGHGGSDITWDYTPARALSIILGSQSGYGGTQTINSGVKLDVAVSTDNTASDLHLNFKDNTSIFQIDGNSNITNMHLGGAQAGQFIINSGTTNIAQAPGGYTELVGTSFVVATGGTLQDFGYNPLQFWGSNLTMKVKGNMLVSWGAGASTKIDINGNTNDYIDVDGGLLGYAGNGLQKDKFTAPVLVEGAGTFQVTSDGQNPGGTLIVQGNLNGVAPGVSNDASVYVQDTSSSVQLANSSTLECDNHYYQAQGILETIDTSDCTLQDGPNNNLGTATIAGGYLILNNPPNGRVGGTYGILNFSCKQLDFNGTYEPYIAGNADGPNTCDVININASSGTINLQGNSSLDVFLDNPGLPNNNLQWTIIQAGTFTNPQFNTTASNPNTPGMTFGPAAGKVYQVTLL